MLSRDVRILNFDDSVIKQNKLLQRFPSQILDFKEIESDSRLWSDKKTAKKITAQLNSNLRNAVTFLGSGDFHHISSLLIAQFREPLCVMIFDHHPDWDILPPKLGCGSWVTNIMNQTNLTDILLLGVSSDDISFPGIQTGNLNSLAAEKVKIYPYEHSPTRVLFRKIPENSSIKIKKGVLSDIIYWEELKNRDCTQFLLKVINALKTRQVYLSIDKDCLSSKYALTNWEEGKLKLEELLSMLGLIKDNLDIVGADITGDYSPAAAGPALKYFCARYDHPKHYSAQDKPESYINSVNEETNIKILETLLN